MRDIFGGLKLFDIDLYKLRSRNFHADMIRDREKVFSDFAGCLRDEHDFICPLCGGCEKRPYLAWRSYGLYECPACGAVSPNVDPARIASLNLHSSPIVEEDVKREILATYDYRKQTFASERLVYLRELIRGSERLTMRCSTWDAVRDTSSVTCRIRVFGAEAWK